MHLSSPPAPPNLPLPTNGSPASASADEAASPSTSASLASPQRPNGLANDPGDRELLFAWNQGDDRAGRALVHRHYRRVYVFVARRAGEAASADLTQSCFEVLCARRYELDQHPSFRAFLYAVARIKIAEHARLLERHRFVSPFGEPLRDDTPSRTMTSVLARRFRHDQLRRALDELSSQDHAVVDLRLREGLSQREIASTVGMPPGTVATRLRRARLLLGAFLRQGAPIFPHGAPKKSGSPNQTDPVRALRA